MQVDFHLFTIRLAYVCDMYRTNSDWTTVAGTEKKDPRRGLAAGFGGCKTPDRKSIYLHCVFCGRHLVLSQ
jgi:hypothetical protein